MSSAAVKEFYRNLGFEEIEFAEDGPTLCYEPEEDGPYATITNEEGTMPASLEERLIFSYYSAKGGFQWHGEFKNSALFAAAWPLEAAPAERFAAIRRLSETDEE